MDFYRPRVPLLLSLLIEEGWREAPGGAVAFPSSSRRGGAKRRGGLAALLLGGSSPLRSRKPLRQGFGATNTPRARPSIVPFPPGVRPTFLPAASRRTLPSLRSRW